MQQVQAFMDETRNQIGSINKKMSEIENIVEVLSNFQNTFEGIITTQLDYKHGIAKDLYAANNNESHNFMTSEGCSLWK